MGIGDWILDIGDGQGEPSPVRYEIEYFVPAVAGDLVEVRSRIVAVGETLLTWEHEVYRGQERSVRASATICLAGDDGLPAPLSESLLEALVN